LEEISRTVRVIGGAGPEQPGPRLPTVLELRAVGCRRSPDRALERVDLQVAQGDLHLVTGERGSGKSTVLELLAGLAWPDRGELVVRGWPTRIDAPGVALDLGIGYVAEEPALVERFTAAESVVLGAEPGRGGHLARRRAAKQVAALAAWLGVPIEPRARVRQLGLGVRRLVEVLALAWRGAEVLLLDEPTAGLGPGETDRVLTALDNLRSIGRTLLVASRSPGELLDLADCVTVLREGRSAATVTAGKAGRQRAAELLAEARHPVTVTWPAGTTVGEVVLQVKGLWVTEGSEEPVAGVDLDVRQAEIHGLVDTAGRGPLALAETLGGLRLPDGGRVYLGNEDVTRASVHVRRRFGLGYLPPADEPGGLVGSLSLQENTALGPHRRGLLRPPGLPSRRALAALAAERAASVGVAARPRTLACQLSRGERQLLTLARELGGPPAALVAACPTRGLGNGAAERVWRRLRAARDAGVAVLLVTADPEEVLALADRVTVMAGGRVAAELDGRWLSESELIRALDAPPAEATPSAGSAPVGTASAGSAPAAAGPAGTVPEWVR